MAEFLLELLSQEIPARMQAQAAADLKRMMGERLEAAGLTFTHSEAHVTPRRLALMVDGLPLQSADTLEERKGPRVGSPDAAIQGFLKGAGLDDLSQAEQRDTGKGVFWFSTVKKQGRPAREILVEAVGDTIGKFPWPKSMRWSNHPLMWVRPLQSILMVLNGVVLDDALSFGDTLIYKGVNVSQGHRFLAPHPFSVTDFADYEAQLQGHSVILDPAKRRAEIKRQLDEQAAAKGLTLVEDESLLNEVTGLVEWPVAMLGKIDDAYMDLPKEVRATTMRANQKYFTLAKPDGTPAPYFAVIANVPGNDEGAAIVAGNERVLRARLSDARFFWDLDRKTKLIDHLPALKNIIFHAKLGTLAERVERMAALASFIADKIGANAKDVAQAARLAKCDLVTGMVGEFPELQGLMGSYYARHDGYDAAIAEAVAEHYSPLGPTDKCPTAPVSIAVALADKLDTLVGFFAIGDTPTGSRDPFALRRAALGVIRIILENNLRLPLFPVITEASRLHAKPLAPDTLYTFITERLKVSLRDKGVRFNLIDAVLNAGADDDLSRIIARVKALEALLATENGVSLLAAYKRAANIVDIESKKDGQTYTRDFDTACFVAAEEKALGTASTESLAKAASLTSKEDFVGSMDVLANLRGPIDAFFDKVRVNDEDPKLRTNRLKLLSAFTQTVNTVADFSRIEGG